MRARTKFLTFRPEDAVSGSVPSRPAGLLRAIHAEDADSFDETEVLHAANFTHNIACNTLTYVFAQKGLPAQ